MHAAFCGLQFSRRKKNADQWSEESIMANEHKYADLRWGTIEAVFNKLGGMEAAQRFLRGDLVVTGAENIVSYPITIDYEQSLEEMVKAGAYDWKNSDITSEHFLIDGNGVVERTTDLVHFNRSISTDDALAELDKQGFRPATIEELLAFGSTNPEIQRQFPIIALGSVWTSRHGSRFVTYLDRDGSRRRLGLYWFVDDDWYDDCRFLAVRK